jgi:tetratricopeptide (TPR) repeat protein
MEPESSKVNYTYGLILSKNPENNKSALEKFEKALKNDAENIFILIAMAETLAKMKKYDEAIKMIQQAIEKSPDFAPSKFLLGAFYAEYGDSEGDAECYRKALTCLNEALEIDPDNIYCKINIAYIKAKQGDEQGFESDFKKMVESCPDYRNMIYENLKNFVEKLNYPKNADEIIN